MPPAVVEMRYRKIVGVALKHRTPICATQTTQAIQSTRCVEAISFRMRTLVIQHGLRTADTQHQHSVVVLISTTSTHHQHTLTTTAEALISTLLPHARYGS